MYDSEIMFLHNMWKAMALQDWRYGIMREDIREIIVEMFDTNASIKTGGIDLAVAKIEALYKEKNETIDEDLKK